MPYHQVAYQATEVKKHLQKGRPSKDSEPSTVGYQITYTISEDADKIATNKQNKGRFILATHQLDESELSTSDMLAEYKGQSSVEGGFKFIKDNSFQVDNVFLKTASRILALMMVMTLCLMTFGSTQYKIHEALCENDEEVPDQKDKETQKPSLKWIYFLFMGVSEVTIKIEGQETQIVSNITGLLKQIIGYCGQRAHAIYLKNEVF